MTNRESDKNKNKILLKHNTLVTARYDLTVEESRIFIYMLYKIQRNIKTDGMFCTITQDELKKIIPNKNKNSVKGVHKILKSLLDNKIYFKREKASNGNIWGNYNFLSGFEYDDELNEFTIECSQRVYDIMMNHDYEKDGYYTPVNLMIWLQLKNSNTQRLYDFIRLWANSKKVINYSVDNLKELMMMESKYDLYADFKRRVLNPSVKELNNTGYFKISMKEVKKRKKVESIDFIVEDMDNRIYFKDNITEQEVLDSLDELHDIPNATNKERSATNRELNMTNREHEDENKQNQRVNYDKSQTNYDNLGINYDKSGICEEKSNMYIPNGSYFTKGTKDRFIKDFIHINFENEYMKNAFDDAIMIALEKDDVDKIKAASYKYFKSTLDNKILEYQKEEEEDIQHKKNLEMFW